MQRTCVLPGDLLDGREEFCNRRVFPTNSRIYSRLSREYKFFFTGLIASGLGAGGRNPRQLFRLYRLSRVAGTASSPKTHASHVQRPVSNSMVVERSGTAVELDHTELAESISSAADELFSPAIARSMLLTLPEDHRSSSFSCQNCNASSCNWLKE